MKLWKHTLISALAFFGIASTVLYTSCADDACLKLNCRNGGTCAENLCKCPTGYEGTQCENKAADRYIGFYAGVTKIDEQPPFLDTARVELGSYPATVVFRRNSRYYDTIRGNINANNIITILNEPNYGGRNITITLDDLTQKLTFQAVEKENGVVRSVNFTGTKR